jgi:uncharacterized protein (TIGR02145 family)
MKTINSLLTGLLLTASVFFTQKATAQAPHRMSYQSVLRNSSNVLLAETLVGIKISVLQGGASGTAVYVETQTATTNANGLVSLQIGTGTASTGSFATINWAAGPYFIKTETDPAGGTNYSITGTQEILSVPFAMYAAKSADSSALQAQVTSLQTTTYPNVLIGTQYWMEKNLEVTNYRNGDIIPYVSDPTAWAGLTTGAWCYYNNDPESGYGKLYNWYAVNDPRGLAPAGWHVPTFAEWTTLTTFLEGASFAGGKMKTTGTKSWTTPNTDATNSSGFSALPGGFRAGTDYIRIGRSGKFWSSTSIFQDDARNLDLYDDYGGSTLGYQNKYFGMSVRCLRD